MGEWRRLFYYLLLNVVVSAVTTMAVLIIWDKMQLSNNDFSALIPSGGKPTVIGGVSAEMSSTPENLATAAAGTAIAPSVEAAANPPAVSPSEIPPATLSPQASLVIDNVIGAGDLPTEKVFVKRIKGEGPLSLANWRIKGPNGQEYVFPQISLYNPGAVYVHTATGADTPRDLYWGKDSAAWSSGADLSLVDDQGNIQATFQIP